MKDIVPKEIIDLTEIVIEDITILYKANHNSLAKQQIESIKLFVPLFHHWVDKLIEMLEQYWDNKKP